MYIYVPPFKTWTLSAIILYKRRIEQKDFSHKLPAKPETSSVCPLNEEILNSVCVPLQVVQVAEHQPTHTGGHSQNDSAILGIQIFRGFSPSWSIWMRNARGVHKDSYTILHTCILGNFSSDFFFESISSEDIFLITFLILV